MITMITVKLIQVVLMITIITAKLIQLVVAKNNSVEPEFIEETVLMA